MFINPNTFLIIITMLINHHSLDVIKCGQCAKATPLAMCQFRYTPEERQQPECSRELPRFFSNFYHAYMDPLSGECL